MADNAKEGEEGVDASPAFSVHRRQGVTTLLNSSIVNRYLIVLPVPDTSHAPEWKKYSSQWKRRRKEGRGQITHFSLLDLSASPQLKILPFVK